MCGCHPMIGKHAGRRVVGFMAVVGGLVFAGSPYAQCLSGINAEMAAVFVKGNAITTLRPSQMGTLSPNARDTGEAILEIAVNGRMVKRPSADVVDVAVRPIDGGPAEVAEGRRAGSRRLFKLTEGRAYCVTLSEGGEADVYVPPRIVRMEGRRVEMILDVGLKDSVFLPFGGRLIPVRQRPKVKVLILPRAFGSTAQANQLLTSLRATLRKWGPDNDVTPFNLQTGETAAASDSTTWVVRLPADATEGVESEVSTALEQVMPRGAALGTFIDTALAAGVDDGLPIGSESLLVATQRYTVKLGHAEESRDRFGRELVSVGGLVLRSLNRDRTLVLVSMPKNRSIAFAARQFSKWQLAGVIEEWEPEIVSPMVDNYVPDEWPDDPDYNKWQRHEGHEVQGVREAWKYLQTRNGQTNERIIRESVVVGLLDTAIDASEPEWSCNAADGGPMLAECFDMTTGEACDPRVGPVPDRYSNGTRKMHGMQMLGVISSCSNNSLDGAGVAPGAKLIAVKRLKPAEGGSQPSVAYGDMLLWMAGVAPVCWSDEAGDATFIGACGWQQPKSNVGARIINLSFGFGWPSVPLYWREWVLPTVVKEGAGGRGTLVVLSAGNAEHERILGGDLRAHPDILTVTNCLRNLDADRDELLSGRGGSSWGDGVGLCALGEGAVTARAACGCSVTTEPCRTAGSSAAAATVSAAAALVFDIFPNATPGEVRDILKSTADKSKLWLGQEVYARGLDQTLERFDCRMSAEGTSKCFGSGRLNAGEAVRKADCISKMRSEGGVAPTCNR